MSACSSGGGAGDVVAAGTVVDIQEQITELNTSDPMQLPTTGRAQYNGEVLLRIAIEDPTLTTYSGDLRLNVNFAAAHEVTGFANNFTADGVRDLGGRLRFVRGNIISTANPAVDFSFEGGLRGTLRDIDDASYVLRGDFSGDFYGREQGIVAGVIYGSVTGPDGVDLFDGSFAAE